MTNNEIVRDPEGWILPGQEHRIEFWLNETDIEATAVLLSPFPPTVRYVLETPAGDVVDPGLAGAHPMVEFRPGQFSAYYRSILPLPIGPAMAQAGRWKAVLRVDATYFKRYLATLDNRPDAYRRAHAHGVRYSFQAQSYSNLRMRARLFQTGREPGATMTLRARLTEYGVPVEHRASVRAELMRPDNSTTALALAEVEPGVFETSLLASASGIYRFRVLASGSTMRGRPFTREQLLTGAVWAGGDRPAPTSTGDPRPERERVCQLLECLLKQESIRRLLERAAINPSDVLECLRRYCHRAPQRPGRTPAGLEAGLRAVLRDDQLVRSVMTHLEGQGWSRDP